MSATNNITLLLTALVTSMQTIEDQLQALLTQRAIPTAVGAQLDVLGRLVGEVRNGLTDAVFRLYISARVAANRSKGTVQDLITVCSLVINNVAVAVKVIQEGAAAVFVDIDGLLMTDPVANVLIDFLKDSVSAGVRPQLGYKYQTDAASFATAPPQQTYSTTSLSVGGTSIPVDSTAAFPSSGSLDLDVGSLLETVTYSSVDATHFLGVSALVNNHATAATIVKHGLAAFGKTFPNIALTAVASLVGAVAVNVDTTTGFPSSGSFIIESGHLNQETVTYTSKNSTFFLGCSALAHTHVVGSSVELVSLPGGQLAGSRDREYTLPVL